MGGDPFAHCALPPPSLDCSVQGVCDAIEEFYPPCGSPGSLFSSDGCLRSECLSDADCATGERCVAPALVSMEECLPSSFGCSQAPDGLCECEWSGDCAGYVVCVPQDLVPPSADCDLGSVDCPSDMLQDSLESLLLNSGDELGAELRTSIEDCLGRVEAARAICDPLP